MSNIMLDLSIFCLTIDLLVAFSVNFKIREYETFEFKTRCKMKWFVKHTRCLSATSFNVRTQQTLQAKFWEKFSPLTNVAAVNNDDDGC